MNNRIINLKDSNLESQINCLSLLPKSILFTHFEFFRKNIIENHRIINFILWGEALAEEISYRKLSKEFEDLLSDTEKARFQIKT